MNSWVIPRNLLDNISASRTSEATYFLFDTDLAKTENSVALLSRSVIAAAKALGVKESIEIDCDELLALANRTESPKLLMKYTFKNGRSKLKIFERD